MHARILIGLGAALLAAPAAAGATALEREVDPVIVSGESLAAAHGRTEAQLRLMALAGDALEAIPFQLDERDADGRFVVPSGKEATRDSDDGRLDANDELVFLAHDAGPRAGAATPWPIGVRAVLEIEAREPDGSAAAFAYLLAFDDPASAPPPAARDDIDFRLETDTVVARHYVLGNTPGTTLFDTLVLRGPDGRSKRDIFDRMKLRAVLDPAIGPAFDIDESRFVGGVLAYKDGVVRVIKRSQVRFKVVGNISVRTDVNDSLFYPAFYVLKKNVNAPVDMDTFFDKVTLKVLADFGSATRGMRFYSEAFPEGFKLDGRMSEAEHAAAASRKASAWHALSSRTRSMVERTTWAESYGIHRRGIYIDDARSALPPEELKGTSPSFGYEVDLSHLKAGDYAFVTHIFGRSRRFVPGDERRLFRVSDAPLEVQVRPAAGAATTVSPAGGP